MYPMAEPFVNVPWVMGHGMGGQSSHVLSLEQAQQHGWAQLNLMDDELSYGSADDAPPPPLPAPPAPPGFSPIPGANRAQKWCEQVVNEEQLRRHDCDPGVIMTLQS